MLVAPDRVLTAGHCVMNVPLSNIAGVVVGTEQHHGTRFALHPGWRHANGAHNVLDDVAIVQLDAPVTAVAPVALRPSSRRSRATATSSPTRRPPLRPPNIDKVVSRFW